VSHRLDGCWPQKAENSEGDRHADEGPEQAPQEGPEEDRKQHDQGKNREQVAGYARLDIAADDELDDIEAGKDAQNRSLPSHSRRAHAAGDTSRQARPAQSVRSDPDEGVGVPLTADW